MRWPWAKGSISIGMNADGTLEVDQGLMMGGGNLWTPDGHTSNITGGTVTINGGNINIGTTGISTLNCEYSVTWTGGTYYAYVDLTANTCSLWHAQGFTIGNNVFLKVFSFHRPAVVPSNLTFNIMTAPQGDPAGIDGVIPLANESLNFSPTRAYTAYVLTTP